MSARLWVLSMVGLLTLPLGGEIRSANQISNPTVGREYFDYVTIDTWGSRDIGTTRTVTLEKGLTIGGEKTFIGPPMAVDWQEDFPAPDGHWKPLGGWSCRLCNPLGAELDSENYTIIVPPPPGP